MKDALLVSLVKQSIEKVSIPQKYRMKYTGTLWFAERYGLEGVEVPYRDLPVKWVHPPKDFPLAPQAA